MTIIGQARYFGETTGRTFQVARQEATKNRSKSVEAEHLLLALASAPTTVCGRVLIEAGLDRERIEALLRQERSESGLSFRSRCAARMPRRGVNASTQRASTPCARVWARDAVAARHLR